MKAFPMFIKTTDRCVVIVGGGEQAAQKARLILKTDAQIVFAATELDPEIEALVEAGRANWHRGPLTEGFFLGAAMVFVATGCMAIDVSAHAIAKAAHCPVNVVDQPHLCDITTPSLVDRDPVVIAIGTEGTAPVLARQIKTQIEQGLAQNLGGLAALSGRLRQSVAHHVARSKRRAFWTWVFSGKPRQLWDRGVEAHAASEIKAAISNHAAPLTCEDGGLSILDAGNSDPELQSLRAVKRLQAADVIFYDRHADDAILEMARRDAERVYIGEMESQPHWSPAWIRNRMQQDVAKGRQVVFLTARFSAHDNASVFQRESSTATGGGVEFVPCAAAPVFSEDQVQGVRKAR